jgi:hypothetical protein
MKIQKFLKVSLLVLLTSVGANAQNARFSQIGSAPIQFNPSLTGRFDGNARLSSLYSWQKSDDPKIGHAEMEHQNISLDFKFGNFKSSGDNQVAGDPSVSKKSNVEGKDVIGKSNYKPGYWGVGINYYHYGSKKSPLEASFYSVSVARHFYNKSNKYYGFGVQATYAQGKLDRTINNVYDRQISGGGFPYRRDSRFDSLVNSQNYVDFNAGAYYGMNTEAVLFELGASMSHLFYPTNDIFMKVDQSKLRHRLALNSLLRLKLNNKWGFVQKNIYWQEGLYYRSSSNHESDTASWDKPIVTFWSGVELYKINPKSKFNLNFGLYTRSFQTIMPYFRLNAGKYVDLRYTYEMPINSAKFKAYTEKRNELSLILSLGRNTSIGTRFYKKTNFW